MVGNMHGKVGEPVAGLDMAGEQGTSDKGAGIGMWGGQGARVKGGQTASPLLLLSLPQQWSMNLRLPFTNSILYMENCN